MANVRIGIIGIGNMGAAHADSIIARKAGRTELTAICDNDPGRFARFSTARGFTDPAQMFRSGMIDAVLIATPHYLHTELGIKALEAGLHVLVEKPLSVHKADCERLIAAYEKRPRKEQVFAAMFNQRTDPHYTKLRQLITSGEIGEVRRVNWIITNWFRTEAYYASGGWRATWKGEGGGVLINQCPHNLDLMWWLFGMPSRLRAFCQFGKWHNIETEDQVTAYLDYPNGATGVFITSTGEAPGTNRLEVTAERGRLVIETGPGADDEHIQWIRNAVPTSEYSRTTSERFSRPETWTVQVPVKGHGGQHNEVLANFADAVLDGKPLIAPAIEGQHSVELANAMILSTLLDKTIELPMDGALYEQQLKKLIAESRFEKKVAAGGTGEDFAKSHTF